MYTFESMISFQRLHREVRIGFASIIIVILDIPHRFMVQDLLLMDTYLLVSGAQFNQFQCFCKFVNLGKPSLSSFYRNKRLYAIPTIEQHYIEMRNNIISETKKQKEVICGDCQLDSPWWSTTYSTYTFMDYSSKKMINMELGDKREVEYWVIHL